VKIVTKIFGDMDLGTFQTGLFNWILKLALQFSWLVLSFKLLKLVNILL